MGKFKVGDRVRIAGGPNNGGFGRVGDTGIIEAVGRAECFVRYDSGSRTGESWYVDFDYLEPAATDDQPASQPQLTIQAGRYYRTRDGRKVGPMSREGEWWHNDDGDYWHPDGRVFMTFESADDLVAEADEPPSAEQQAGSTDYGSTAGFTVPLCAYEDEPGWYVTELGRAYADGYAAGLQAGSEEANDKAAAAHCFRDDVDRVVLDCLKRFKKRGLLAA